MKIIIENINCKIEFEGLEYAKHSKSLREYLRVKVKGTHFMDNKKWDGYRYFISPAGNFATGFLPKVLDFLIEEGVNFEIVDIRKNKFEYNKDLDFELPNGYKLEGKFDHQQEVVKKAVSAKSHGMEFYRGIVDSATNSGKNSIMGCLAYNIPEEVRIILICRMRTTFDEAVKFFSGITKISKINSDGINFGRFTIAMQKTLYNRAKKFPQVRQELTKFHILFSDEAHESGGAEYSRLLTWIDAYARYFVSGTPLDMPDPVQKMIIIGMSGPIIAKITNKEMIDKKVSLRPRIKLFLNRHQNSMRHLYYDDEYREVVKLSQNRVDILKDELKKNPNAKVYVAFREKEHGEFIFDELWKDSELRHKIEWTHGEDPDRDIKVDNFKKGRVQILICSLILKQSINIQDINILAYMLGGMSKIDLKQLVGRVLRDDGVSEEVEVWDFYDVGKWVEDHSKARIRIYRKEEFDITYNYPSTKLGYLKRD